MRILPRLIFRRRNSNSRKHLPNRNCFRSVRFEPLESRVMLDGTGGMLAGDIWCPMRMNGLTPLERNAQTFWDVATSNSSADGNAAVNFWGCANGGAGFGNYVWGKLAGDAGVVEINTGVNPSEADNPVNPVSYQDDLRDSAFLDGGTIENPRHYYYRQIAPDEQGEEIILKIKGHVIIHTQLIFQARVEGDFAGGTPSLTVFAGQPYWVNFPGNSNLEPAQVRIAAHYVELDFTPTSEQYHITEQDHMQGGNFRFYTAANGDIEAYIQADGGTISQEGVGFHDGGKAGVVKLNAGSPAGEVRILKATANGGVSGYSYVSDNLEFPGRDGGQIVIAADSVAIAEYEFSKITADGAPGIAGRGGGSGVWARGEDGSAGGGGGAIRVQTRSLKNPSDRPISAKGGKGGKGGRGGIIGTGDNAELARLSYL